MDLGDIASIILAVLTAFYVFFTWRLNQNAQRSAASAETSATASQAATQAALKTAQASQRAAEAAEQSAALSEAAIHVDFSVEQITTTGPTTVITVRSDTANVHLFSLHVRLSVVSASGSIHEVAGTTTVLNDLGKPVTFLHKGEGTLAFLDGPIAVGTTVWGQARVHYGFAPESPGRERLVEIPRQPVRDFTGRTTSG